MITFARSTASRAAHKRSPVQARNSQNFSTELIAVISHHLRCGFPKLESSGGFLVTNNATTWAQDMYLSISISATWSSGETASLSATVSDQYSDATVSTTYSWKSGSTLTDTAFADLSNNADCCGLAMDAPSGKTSPTTGPTGISITSDTTATLTWDSGGSTVLTLEVTLSNAKSYADFVSLCTASLQHATLLDEAYAPSKTYSASVWNGGGYDTHNVMLRWKSTYDATNSGTWPQYYTNVLILRQSRGAPDGISYNCAPPEHDITTASLSPIFPSFTHFSYYKPGSGGTYAANASAIRILCAYGMNNSQILTPSINAICSIKTAVRAVTAMSGGIVNEVDLSDGSNAESGFTPPYITSVAGVYIFDPVPLMASPPTGYQADPSGGGLVLPSLWPITDINYGSAYWGYV